MTKLQTLALPIGTQVYCTVLAVRGWYQVVAIRPRDGYIKIESFNTWNPPHNFELAEPEYIKGTPQ